MTDLNFNYNKFNENSNNKKNSLENFYNENHNFKPIPETRKENNISNNNTSNQNTSSQHLNKEDITGEVLMNNENNQRGMEEGYLKYEEPAIENENNNNNIDNNINEEPQHPQNLNQEVYDNPEVVEPNENIESEQNQVVINENTNTESDEGIYINQNHEGEALYVMNLELENKNVELRIYENTIPDELAYEFCKKHKLDFSSMKDLSTEIEKLLIEYRIKIGQTQNDYNNNGDGVIEGGYNNNIINNSNELKKSVNSSSNNDIENARKNSNKNDKSLNNYENEDYNNNNSENSGINQASSSGQNFKKTIPSKRSNREFDIIYEEDKEELLGKGDTRDRENEGLNSNQKNDFFKKFDFVNEVAKDNSNNTNNNMVKTANFANNNNKNNLNFDYSSRHKFNEKENYEANDVNDVDNNNNNNNTNSNNMENNDNIENYNDYNNENLEIIGNLEKSDPKNIGVVINDTNNINNNNYNNNNDLYDKEKYNFNNNNNYYNSTNYSNDNQYNNNNINKNQHQKLFQYEVNQGNIEINNNKFPDGGVNNSNFNSKSINNINDFYNKNFNNTSNNTLNTATQRSSNTQTNINNNINNNYYRMGNFNPGENTINTKNYKMTNETDNNNNTKTYNKTKQTWEKDVFKHLYEDSKNTRIKKMIHENYKIQEKENEYYTNLQNFKSNFPTTKIHSSSMKAGEDMFTRGKTNQDRISRKIHLMKNREKERVHEECSFSPQINERKFKNVSSSGLQKMDFKEFQKKKKIKIDSIKKHIVNDDMENTFRPRINKKSTEVQSLVYDLNFTHVQRMKSEVKVMKEKEKNEYFKPRFVSPQKNEKILVKSKNFSLSTSMRKDNNDDKNNRHYKQSLNNNNYNKQNNHSLNPFNSQSIESNSYQNINISRYPIGESIELSNNNLNNNNNMLQMNQEYMNNMNNNMEIEEENDNNILIKDNYNNNNNNNNNPYNTHSHKNISSINNIKTTSLTSNPKINKISSMSKLNSNNNNNNKQITGYFVSPTFDYRQERYKELKLEKIENIKNNIVKGEQMKSDSITLIHTKRLLKEDQQNKIDAGKNEVFNNINNPDLQNDNNNEDIFTKNYNYAIKYKQNKDVKDIENKHHIERYFNQRNTNSYSQKIFEEKKEALFKKLFKILDFDHDNLITKRSVGVNRLNKKLNEIISPLIKELITEDETLNCDEFVQAMGHLNNCLSYVEKNDLIREIQNASEKGEKSSSLYNNNKFNYPHENRGMGIFSNNNINSFNVTTNNNNNNYNNHNHNIIPSTNLNLSQHSSGINSERMRGTNSTHNYSQNQFNNNNNINNNINNSSSYNNMFNNREIKSNTINYTINSKRENKIPSKNNLTKLNKHNTIYNESSFTFKPKINDYSRKLDSRRCMVKNFI